MKHIMCMVLTVKPVFMYRLQGVPELTNSLFTLSVGDHSFRSRLGLNFYSVLHTTEHPVYNIVSNFHVNTFYIYIDKLFWDKL